MAPAVGCREPFVVAIASSKTRIRASVNVAPGAATAPVHLAQQIRRSRSPPAESSTLKVCKNDLSDGPKATIAKTKTKRTTKSKAQIETLLPPRAPKQVTMTQTPLWVVKIRAMTAPPRPRSKSSLPRRKWAAELDENETGVDPFLLGGLGRGTRLRHLALRTRLKEFADGRPLTDEIAVAFLRAEQTARGWDASTMATAAGNLLGAMRAGNTPLGPKYLMAMKAIDALKMMAPVRWPEILSPTELETAINAAQTDQARISLIMAATAGQRMGDVLQVATSNVMDHEQIADDAIAFLLTEGKTSKTAAVPIYTCLRAWAPEVRAYVAHRRSTGHPTLFDDTPKLRAEILRSIRIGNPRAEFKSLRATKILGLGMSGAALPTIGLVAQHSSEEMTMHYLRGGLAYAAGMQTVQTAQLDVNQLI